MYWTWIISIVLSYLLGSITFSYVVGKLLKGIDIRKHGSGNAGATNALRVLGKGPAISILLLDIAKGVVAVLIARSLFPDHLWVSMLCGLAVIIGHNWPIYFGFRGGKGIATTIGVVMTLAIIPSLISGAISILAIILTRYVSLGSLIYTLLLPVIVYMMDGVDGLFYTSLAIWILAWMRHRSNIVRIVRGEENRIGQKSS